MRAPDEFVGGPRGSEDLKTRGVGVHRLRGDHASSVGARADRSAEDRRLRKAEAAGSNLTRSTVRLGDQSSSQQSHVESISHDELSALLLHEFRGSPQLPRGEQDLQKNGGSHKKGQSVKESAAQGWKEPHGTHEDPSLD